MLKAAALGSDSHRSRSVNKCSIGRPNAADLSCSAMMARILRLYLEVYGLCRLSSIEQRWLSIGVGSGHVREKPWNVHYRRQGRPLKAPS